MTVKIRYEPPKPTHLSGGAISGIALLVIGVAALSFHFGMAYQQGQRGEIADRAQFQWAEDISRRQVELDSERHTSELLGHAVDELQVELEKDDKELDVLRARRALLEPFMKAGTLVIAERAR